MFVKIFKFIAVIVLLLVVCLAISIPVRQHTKFDAPYPQITSSKDSSVIARGKYLVYGVAKCASCHGNSLNSDSLIHLGQEPDLSGGLAFEIAFGRFYSSNITPDKATGIGGMTDKELARVLRHNVKKNGELVLPLMTAQNLSDEDLTAIISYLRTLKPVNKQSAKQEYNFLGKLLKAYVLQPQGPDMAVVKAVLPDTTAVYGKYVAIGLANCRECHTKQSNTGEYIGRPMEGGRVFEMPGKDPLASPNITFKKEGRLHGWNLDAFIQRFRAGKLIEHSHMPWGSFSRMSDNDLKALYKYLQDPE